MTRGNDEVVIRGHTTSLKSDLSYGQLRFLVHLWSYSKTFLQSEQIYRGVTNRRMNIICDPLQSNNSGDNIHNFPLISYDPLVSISVERQQDTG